MSGKLRVLPKGLCDTIDDLIGEIRRELSVADERMMEELPDRCELVTWSNDEGSGFSIGVKVHDDPEPFHRMTVEAAIEDWVSYIFDPDCAHDLTEDEPSIQAAMDHATYLRNLAQHAIDTAKKIEARIQDLATSGAKGE